MNPRLVVAIACVLLVVQELPYFQTRWIEDESSYSDAAWTFAREGRIRMSMYPPTDVGSTVDVRPPAMPIALGSMFRVFGLGVWQARLLPFLCAIAALVVTFLLGRELAGVWAGALAALLLATDNTLFVAARTARPEGIVTLLNTLALLLGLLAVRRDSWIYALVAGLVAGVSINFHINGAIPALAMLLWCVYQYGFSIWRKPVAWIFGVTFLLCVLPYVMWVTADPLHQRAYREMQALGTQVQTAASKLRGELMRYADFLAISNAKLPLPVRAPLRGHIVAIIAGGLVVLWMRRRPVFWYAGLAVLANMAWWFYLANKNVRYTAVAAPMFAIIVAAAVVAISTSQMGKRIAIAVCLLYGLTQIGGNAFLNYQFRNADYVTLTAQLRDAIPPGETVWGANTFWLALHDRHYYSYDRSPFAYTTNQLKPTYFILYDRVMLNGYGTGADDFRQERENATAFMRLHSERTATIADGFYGDLQIFHATH